jgi:hypothetical protein
MADPQPSSARRRRCLACLLSVMCVAALGGVLTACGEDEEDRTEPAALDTARLGKITRLSSAQYQALKRVYEVSDDLERNDNSGLDFDIVVADVLDACERRGRGDPLLTPVLAGCAEFVKFATAVVEVVPCVGTELCIDLYDTARTRVQKYGLALRLSDRAVKATRLPRRCKRLFTAPKSDYRIARRYDRAIDTLQAAARTPSTGDDAIAAKRFLRLDFGGDSSSSSSSTSGDLRTLRRSCRRR